MSEKCKYHKECSFPTLLYFYLVRKIMSVQGFFFVGFKKGENLKKVVKKVVLGLVSSVFVWGAASCTLFADDDDDSVAVQNSSSPAVELEKENKAEKKSEEKKKSPDDKNNTVTPGGTPATGVMDTPTVANVSNVTVNIVKSEGWLNSAYIVFEQVEGATYKVLCDEVELDAPLIRYYDTYTYYEKSENEELQVKWTKKSLSKVVRADALGLAAGSHTIKVCAVGTENTSEYSTATMTVVDHDRSGFAFAPEATTTPGAYKADGTLKEGAIVIYLTQGNKKTVTATIGGKTYTGIQEITQAIKTKNTSNPVDIRIIGTVTAESNDLSCADMSSAYALGVKEAKNVTIEGVGHDATLYKAGVAAFKCDYIEIANLGLMKWGGGGDGDGISLKEDSYAWIHNCDYFYGDAGGDADQAKGDGSMDLKDDSNHVTISYNHFWDSGKMSLCGMKSETGPNWITYHHNWFDHSDSRHPRIRTMTVHVYNNYFDGNSKYGVGAAYKSNAFVEQNFFRDAHDPMMSSMQGTDAQGDGTFSGEDGGVIKSYNNKFVQNNKYQKFQFITNKYDYTNNVAVTAPETHTESLGTLNDDGTYTLYSWAYGDAFPSFVTKSAAVDKEDGSGTKQYYQISKEKTGFTITVPENASKVIVTAKSASSGVTSATLKIGEVSQSVSDGNYPEYTFDVSSLSSTSLDVVAGKEGSINIKSIKVIAPTAWETTYTTGVDLTDIDAYEVDNRSDQVPATVKAKQGGVTYSNFDVEKGDSGMGIKIAVTDPDTAKENVLKYSGRHESDYNFSFDNSVDDASYSLNTTLNSEILAYTSGMVAVQGYTQSSSGSGSIGTSTEENVAVTGVSLSNTTLTLKAGKNETITATIEPANATTQDVTWATSDSKIAKVSNGKITAVAEGEAAITVTTKDGSFSATCKVTVEAIHATDLTLSKTALELTAGKTETITATLEPTDATDSVTWSSGDKAIVTVDKNGKITAVAEGTVTITAKAGTIEKTCTVTVTAAPADDLSGLAALASGTYNLTTKKIAVDGTDIAAVFSSQSAGESQTKSGILITAKIDSKGANLSTKAVGTVYFKIDSGKTISFSDSETKGVALYAVGEDGTVSETAITNESTAPSYKYTLEAGTYVIKGTSGSSAKVASITVE